MQEQIHPLVIALVVGIVAGSALLPLARVIPLNLEKRWRLEFEAQKADFEAPLDQSKYALALQEKIAIAVASPLIAMTLLYFRELNISTLFSIVYFLGLLLLCAINFKHTLLPDVIVFPLIWLGLCHHAFADESSPYVLGASLAYLIPYSLLVVVRLKTGKDVIGYGDLKCFALAGAWFGLAALPTLFAAFIAVTIAQIFLAFAIRFEKPLPTGFAHFIASGILSAGIHVF